MTAKEFEKKLGFWLFCGAEMWTSLPELPPLIHESPLVIGGWKLNTTSKNSALCVLIGEKQFHVGFYSQIDDMEPIWRDDHGYAIHDKILKWIPIPNQKQED